ncbi:hypothetical protein H6G11_15680 [Cyanobacterium aponinum FACHB-4101]|uniref:hypothetical protein n=1 Tax=Cyanobacterium aponinum TaxID=379064 RepID=UPI001680CDE5|nr:hypothetical protein [Cyanobacterium aponinum]MBD2395685.1 hypothetical protein [Cyanobacterium aponinum FACHB-4101]
MTLSNHKIPIITGRNDVPTTSESEANHPNGSYLIDKYNNLIDNIPTEVQGIARSSISVTGSGGNYNSQTGVITLTGSSGISGTASPITRVRAYLDTVYVNSSTGDDSSGDGSINSPFATIQKGIDYLYDTYIAIGEAVYVGKIDLGGVSYVNPMIDTSRFPELVSSFIFGYGINSYFKGGIELTNGTIVYDYTGDEANYTTMEAPDSLIKGSFPIFFSVLNIENNSVDNLRFVNNNLYFEACTLTCNNRLSSTYTETGTFFHFVNCKAIFNSCTFELDTSKSMDKAITAYYSNVHITLTNLNDSNPTPSNLEWFYRSYFNTISMSNADVYFSSNNYFNTIFLHLNGSLATDWFDIEENIIKEKSNPLSYIL